MLFKVWNFIISLIFILCMKQFQSLLRRWSVESGADERYEQNGRDRIFALLLGRISNKLSLCITKLLWHFAMFKEKLIFKKRDNINLLIINDRKLIGQIIGDSQLATVTRRIIAGNKYTSQPVNDVNKWPHTIICPVDISDQNCARARTTGRQQEMCESAKPYCRRLAS
jgi:hypothetical protein